MVASIHVECVERPCTLCGDKTKATPKVVFEVLESRNETVCLCTRCVHALGDAASMKLGRFTGAVLTMSTTGAPLVRHPSNDSSTVPGQAEWPPS